MEACNGSLVNDGVRNYVAHQKYNKDYSTLTASERSKIDLSIKNVAEATLFLMCAGGNALLVRQQLSNDYIRGTDKYPTDITSARAFIVNYSSGATIQPPQQQHHYPPNHDDLSHEAMLLTQNGERTPVDTSKIKCHHPDCGQLGHYQNSTACPIRRQEMSKRQPSLTIYRVKYKQLRRRPRRPIIRAIQLPIWAVQWF